MGNFIAEIKEEFYDFIEDFSDLLKKRPQSETKSQKSVVINGGLTYLRPAYLFAERIENVIKMLFGISVLLSAITASFVGFASLSGLVDTLINSVIGRIGLFFIGLSYVTIAIWKILHLGQSKQN